ncbi:hypothetical protein [Saezia sanguinis]|uniref:hypothetical protein n=1 Tax=Saezia sanguinis TaxID=1965230 RepID=UPI0030DA4289
METSFADLKKKILANQASAFRLYCQNKTAKPWLASFGYSTNTFGSGFFHVDAQYPDTGTHFEELIALIKELDRLACFSYGIAYSASEVTDAFYYATGNNFVNIFPYENSSAWKRELPGLYNGQARYQNSMLRMVYPINIINDHHLDIDVAGSTLREWIESNAIHGSLEKLNRMWLWKVDMNNLDHVNQCCGEAGVLISWRKPVAKTAIRKLP